MPLFRILTQPIGEPQNNGQGGYYEPKGSCLVYEIEPMWDKSQLRKGSPRVPKKERESQESEKSKKNQGFIPPKNLKAKWMLNLPNNFLSKHHEADFW